MPGMTCQRLYLIYRIYKSLNSSGVKEAMHMYYLASSDGVIPEGVLLALGARVLGGAGDEGGADAVSSLLIAGGGGGAGALLTLWEPEVFWLTPLTLLSNHMILAAALT